MFETIAIALAIPLMVTAIIYAFRARQLYLVLPCLFSESALTSTGKLVEIRLINKSRATEEEILIALSPDRSYEIVASTDASPVLDKTTIHIPRLPPGDVFSILVMVEGGSFTKDQISTVSSKTTKGVFVDSIEAVPPNIGNVILGIVFSIALVAIPLYGVSLYDKWQENKSERLQAERVESLQFLEDRGWLSIEGYAFSDLSQNYSQGEFPLFQKQIIRQGNIISVPFTIINKSAALLELRATPETPYEDQNPRSWETSIIELAEVAPGEKAEISVSVYWPIEIEGVLTIDFNIVSGDDRFIRFQKQIDVDI